MLIRALVICIVLLMGSCMSGMCQFIPGPYPPEILSETMLYAEEVRKKALGSTYYSRPFKSTCRRLVRNRLVYRRRRARLIDVLPVCVRLLVPLDPST